LSRPVKASGCQAPINLCASAGQPVLLRVLQPFIDCLGIDRIVVVLNNRNYDEVKR